MQKVKIEPFHVIGIKVRTTNQNGQSAKDIGQLWQKFLSEGIQDKIPGKLDECILSIYTNYAGDHTQPYDTILACRVSSLDNIPKGMIGQSFKGGNYSRFNTLGNLNEGIVYHAWVDIWQKDLNRAFTADFEEYGAKAQDRSNAAVDIFVALQD